MENTDILKAEIKSILAVKAKQGATYRNIKGIIDKNGLTKVLMNAISFSIT